MILVADIGGTKCLLAMRGDDGKLGEATRFPSGSYATFDSLLSEYLDSTGHQPTAACFAVAGPVQPGGVRAHLTQLPWILEADELARGFKMQKVTIINDFHAQALAALGLGAEDLAPLQGGDEVAGGAKAVLGAGTGLGQASLVMAGGRYEVVPSEGGHCDFAPTTERQAELLRYLLVKFPGHVSYERVLSGAGLAHCYQFLRDRGYGVERPATRELMKMEDPAAVVSRLGASGEDQVCAAALDLFCEVYGQEAGNLALKVMALGGVYICGGIAPRILPQLKAGAFLRGFRGKGRLKHVVERMPVWVVTNTQSGLIGAGVAAGRM